MENGKWNMKSVIRKIIATSGLTFVNLAGRMSGQASGEEMYRIRLGYQAIMPLCYYAIRLLCYLFC